MAAGEFTLSIRDNEVSLFFEIANEAASVRAYEHLGLILAGAIKQAKNDPVFMEAFHRMLQGLVEANNSMRAVAPPAVQRKAGRHEAGAFGAVTAPRRATP